jgi:hypothetical protein
MRLACWFRRRTETNFHEFCDLIVISGGNKKSAITRRLSPARETQEAGAAKLNQLTLAD